MFADGEPSYTCSECGVDPTCVLCHKCFMKSEHRQHRFTVHISHGGGCCDCGDQEAWRGHAFCRIHKPHGDKEPTASEALAQLPRAVSERLYDTIDFVLRASAHVLASDDGAMEAFVPTSATSLQCTTLYNDEVHTFDQVIGQLRRAVGAPADLGRTWANYVDVEGRAVVKVGREAACIAAARVLCEIELDGREEPLTTVATQEVLTEALLWLCSAAKEVDAIRAVVCGCVCDIPLDDVLANRVTHKRDPLLKTLLLHMIRMWKRGRAAVRGILFSSVMLEIDYKAVLAVQFTQNYSEIIRLFADDANEDQGGIGNISVQIYTVPSLSRMLVQEHHVLTHLLGCLRTLLRTTPDGRVDCQQPFRDETVNVLVDLRYILRNDVGSALPMIPALVNILGMQQYMDPMVRKTGEHVHRESTSYRVAFQLTALTASLLSRLMDEHNLPPGDLEQAVAMLVAAVHSEVAASPATTTVYCAPDDNGGGDGGGGDDGDDGDGDGDVRRPACVDGFRIPRISVQSSANSWHHPIQR